MFIRLPDPPFSGFVMRDEAKQGQSKALMRSLGATGSRLDYVTAWFLKAGEYVQTGSARIGFVATNSITQGEQVAQLWPALFNRWKLEIAFAHRTFAWGSDARGVAHVHVVIIGLTKRDDEPKDKRLFSYDDVNGHPVESRHPALSPYLFDASGLVDRHLVVSRKGLKKAMAQHVLVETDRVISDEDRGRPSNEPSADLAHHLVVGRLGAVGQTRNGKAVGAQRARMRDHMGLEASANLKAAQLVEVMVRSDRCEVDDLVKGRIKPRRLGIEEDITHGARPLRTNRR